MPAKVYQYLQILVAAAAAVIVVAESAAAAVAVYANIAGTWLDWYCMQMRGLAPFLIRLSIQSRDERNCLFNWKLEHKRSLLHNLVMMYCSWNRLKTAYYWISWSCCRICGLTRGNCCCGRAAPMLVWAI